MKQTIHIQNIVTIHYFEFSKNFYFAGESHNFWEMVYVDKGEVIATAEDTDYTIRQGHAIFHKPNEFHKIAANNMTAPNVFIITFVCTSRDMRFFKDRIMEIPTKLRDLISLIIEEAQQCYMLPIFDPYLERLKLKENPKIGAEQLVKLYLEQFLILLLRNDGNMCERRVLSMNESIDDQLVKAIIGYLEARVFQTVSVNELCKQFNYSKTYLSKLFKNVTDRTISEYYTGLKISEAKRMIREKNLNFTQIANRLCFDSPQYFSRTFKRITGMTPKEYKNSVKAD